MKMRLTIDVEYFPEGTINPEKAARTLLEHVAQQAANRGHFTGNTPLRVRTWSHQVEVVKEESDGE
jgi:hypothetical protein